MPTEKKELNEVAKTLSLEQEIAKLKKEARGKDEYIQDLQDRLRSVENENQALRENLQEAKMRANGVDYFQEQNARLERIIDKMIDDNNTINQQKSQIKELNKLVAKQSDEGAELLDRCQKAERKLLENASSKEKK